MFKKLYVIIIIYLLNQSAFGYERYSENVNHTTSRSILKELICNQTDSCVYSHDISKQYDNFQIRTCMCDKQCSMYNDCCRDSEYREVQIKDEKFTCVNTPYDGHIYMLHRCPLDYTNLEIIKLCESTNNTDPLSDILLYTPVTSEIKNITYRNVFCAFCHEELQFEFWNLVLEYESIYSRHVKLIPQYFPTSFQLDPQIDVNSLLSNLKVIKNQTTLVSQIRGSIYKCDLSIKMPNRLSEYMRYCRRRISQISENKTNQCVDFTSQESPQIPTKSFEIYLNSSFLTKMNHRVSMQLNNTAYQMLRYSQTNNLSKEEQSLDYCFFNTLDGKLCLINTWLKESIDFYYLDNETIFVKKFKSKFNAAEWIQNLENEKEIFLCGTEIPSSVERKFYTKINNVITSVLIKLSIFFLIIHLFWSATDNKLQSLPNKIMYTYSSTLLLIYIFWDLEERLPSCTILAVLIHYLCLSCFTWLLIASYDCWLVICHSSAKFQTFAGKSRLKRYLFYSLCGWGFPLAIITVAVYFELAANSKIPCYLKPGYGRLKQCFVGQESPLNYFYYYPTAVITCLNISLFLHTSYHIFANKQKNITSTAQNNSYSIFIRLSLNMGIVAFMVLLWTLYILVVETDFLLFHTMQNIFQAAQGVFMFLLFSMDKSMIRKVMKHVPTS